MCGIAGCVVARGDAPDRAALDRMAVALAHRGPDDHGVQVIGSVGLVHTRLAILDPTERGHQPMRHRDSAWWTTYNGEVFNHLELRRELPPREYAGGSDTETLLEALDAWGVDAFNRLNGLFAFAALDLERRRLLLVRDRFGVKPLYYARHAGALWFASEMRALLAAGVPARPRGPVLAHSLMRGWANGPATPIEGIRRVLPGTFCAVDIDTLTETERRWYEPGDAVDPDAAHRLARLGSEQRLQAVEDGLRQAVRRRLLSDVPVGTMCSGGIDSSLITALAAEEQPGIRAYNAAVSDQADNDENRWARHAASVIGVELRTVAQDADTWRRDLVDVVRHVEYPLTHESSVPMAQIAVRARADGVKVLLSGEGADELFGGYGARHVREYADFHARHRRVEACARSIYRRLQSRGLRRPADPYGGPAREVSDYERGLLDRARTAYSHHRGARGRLEALLAADLGTYLPHLLNRQDKSTMRGSIETRVPFLDPNFVTLAVNLPLEARVEPDRKAILRELARRRFGNALAERSKIGFTFDVRRYLYPAARRPFLMDGCLREALQVPAAEWTSAIARADTHPQHPVLWWSGEIWARAVLAGQSREAIEAELWGEAA
jgi:asparagine synthase (glutamine-hydrolysing)